MNKKLALIAAALIAAIAFWNFFYIPHQEISKLMSFRNRIVALYAEHQANEEWRHNNFFKMPEREYQEESHLRASNLLLAARELKKDLYKETVLLSTKDALKVVKPIKKAMNTLLALSEIDAEMERDFLFTGKSEKEKLEKVFKLEETLEYELIPELRGL